MSSGVHIVRTTHEGSHGVERLEPVPPSIDPTARVPCQTRQDGILRLVQRQFGFHHDPEHGGIVINVPAQHFQFFIVGIVLERECVGGHVPVKLGVVPGIVQFKERLALVRARPQVIAQKNLAICIYCAIYFGIPSDPSAET